MEGFDSLLQPASCRIVVPGEPVGKGRPRFVLATGRAYTPEKTARYEHLVKLEYERQHGPGLAFGRFAQIGLKLDAFFSIPQSVSRAKRAKMACGQVRPTKKPDLDNVIKTVGDALNGLAYYDDSQIVFCEVRKYYAEVPRLEIQLFEV